MKYILSENDLEELFWDSALGNEEIDIKKFEIDTVNLYNAIKTIPDRVFDRNETSIVHSIDNKKDLMDDLVQNLEINFLESVCNNLKE